MSLGMYFEKATGKATCKICSAPIKKGITCIFATDGWRSSGHCHTNKKACDKAREELEWKINQN